MLFNAFQYIYFTFSKIGNSVLNVSEFYLMTDGNYSVIRKVADLKSANLSINSERQYF